MREEVVQQCVETWALPKKNNEQPSNNPTPHSTYSVTYNVKNKKSTKCIIERTKIEIMEDTIPKSEWQEWRQEDRKKVNKIKTIGRKKCTKTYNERVCRYQKSGR